MNLKKVIKCFKRGNVLVYGLRGRGKDVLMGNVVARTKAKYISNLDYTKDERKIDFNPEDFNCGKNSYRNFLDGNILPYKFPYPLGTDIYISDAGTYFPAQYNNELNRDYKYFPTYFALSRQLSGNNIFMNAQSLNRIWDKIREQCDCYIKCCGCKFLFGFVFMRVIIYDKYESALAQVEPFSLKLPLRRNKQTKMMYELEKERYRQTHGSIRAYTLIFRNKSKHDTLYFKSLLEGENDEKITTDDTPDDSVGP